MKAEDQLLLLALLAENPEMRQPGDPGCITPHEAVYARGDDTRSFGEIASLLGISEADAKSDYQRAMRKIRKRVRSCEGLRDLVEFRNRGVA